MPVQAVRAKRTKTVSYTHLDNQYFAACLKNGFVHHAVFVIENAQVDYLLAKPVNIFFSIGLDVYKRQLLQ